MNSTTQVFRKRVIIKLYQQGLSQQEIAKVVDLSQGRVSQIIKETTTHKGQIQSPELQR